MTIATGDSVTLEYTGRTDDGTVFDTSREAVAEDAGLTDPEGEREYAPLTIDVGAQQVIEGMEEGLLGLEQGESTTIEVPPEKGYGEWSEEEVQSFETAELSEMLGGQTPDVGEYLEAQNGQVGEVVHAGDEEIRVDFNHELAGEKLAFDVEIVDVN
ncbi:MULTISPECIES: peptidylprolyl isomerase [Halobacterium]|uniref:FKBP-type peptidyl-prolyl cis-trans isomerase n=1 Tax=Halobacterium TaxID=2239 RepID=UPI0009E66801|nr:MULTISPECIES: FKBP-type peptidyl-prolyl cis-trans isomerase [Halobacterium]MCG1003199.1 FKBP-type peptidyl-prolyl cis-trans isomerase [Halobacterium noricense]